MLFKKNQSGRSMVEMLGVLAIIGVLSVGGITGYRQAMEKHKVNEFLNYLQMDLINAENEFQSTGQVSKTKSVMPSSFCYLNKPNCWTITYPSRISYQDNVPNEFCRALKSVLSCDKLTETEWRIKYLNAIFTQLP